MLDTLLALPHYLISFIVILSIIVFIHEFGHFIVARWCGVKVEAFSIGFGKEIFGWHDKHGTRWKFSLLPLGGYVKMFGDAGAASTADVEKLDGLSEEDKALTFHHKPLWKKALVVGAGPLANFILTILIFTYFVYSTGMSSTAPVVGEIIPDTPAQAAGLQAGDKIVTVDGSRVKTFGEIPDKILTNLGSPVELTLIRGGETLTLTVTPEMREETDVLGNAVKRPLIGFKSQQITYEDVSLPGALLEATRRTYGIIVMTMDTIGQMITGQRSAKDLTGPVGIAELSGKVTKSGDTFQETLNRILWFMAIISANLGFVNLLPIPLLDGGHLMFYAIEGARGRPMAERVQEWGYRIGFGLLICLMGFTIFNDIRKLVT